MFRQPRFIIGALIVLAAAVAAYYFLSGRSNQVAQKAAPPPPEVGVVELRRTEVPLALTYAGRVAGFRIVEVRPQISGTILKREYIEGTKVKQGDVLFRIDPRTYQAALDRANAQLAQAEATSVQAEENFNRIDELAKRQVATAKQLEDARAARDQSRAAIAATKADISNAKLNIEFTTISAPVSGPTSLVSPPEGSLALAQQTILTTITQLDPAYVNFSTSESEFTELRDINRARDKPLTEDDITVTLQHGDGTAYPIQGKLNVSSSTVDARTGTIQIRSIFPNSDGALLPNQFVRVLLTGVSLPNVFVIPQQAISQGPQGAFVYVLNAASNGVVVRPVKLDREVKGGWVVKDGVNDGDKVVIDGVMRIRPGAPVKPVPFVAKESNAKPGDAKGDAKASSAEKTASPDKPAASDKSGQK